MNELLTSIFPVRGAARPQPPSAGPGGDTRMRFTVDPQPGVDAFQQWCDAMKAVARLPLGIPPEFRKNVWLSLADYHLFTLKLDWEKTVKFAFNEKTNPDDNNLGEQIVKDLHRTGCSGFSGHDNTEDRAVLKRVLLAYARWNKAVGYCQGFNVLAALVLDVVDRKEDDALKVLIYLIDHVLPDSYFANNLRALSVDMAVFRALLRLKFPKLSSHLDHLQAAAGDNTTGANYEPPLTNVFTMQWFLTLFATCLPQATALRVWDSVLLEGSEVLLRTALAIWGKLSGRILAVQSADEFYTTMGVLTQEMLDDSVVDADQLVQEVYSVAPFPFPQLTDLREKYTYNITPFTAAMSTGRRPAGRAGVDDDDLDEDDLVDQINCFTGMFPQQVSPSRDKSLSAGDRSQSGSAYDMSKAGPGAYAENPAAAQSQSSWFERKMMDIDQLNKQYRRLRERQKQAHIILAAASAKHLEHQAKARSQRHLQEPCKPAITGVVAPPIQSPMAVNHLFIGRKNSSNKRNRQLADAPSIAPFYSTGDRTTQLVGIQSTAGQSKSKGSSDIAKIRRDYELQRQKSNLSSQNSQPKGEKSGNSEQLKECDKLLNAVEVYGGQSDCTKVVERNVELSVTEVETQNVGPAGQAPDCLADGASPGHPVVDSDMITLQPGQRDGNQQPGAGSVECANKDDGTTVPSGVCHESVDSGPLSGSSMNSGVQDDPGEQNSSVQQEDMRHSNPASQSLEYPAAPPSKPTLLQLAQQGSAGGASSPDQNTRKTPQPTRQVTPTKQGKTCHSNSSQGSLSCENPKQTNQATSPVSGTKMFNPFPSRLMNAKRAQNGLRLGLYSPESLPISDKNSSRNRLQRISGVRN